MQGTIERIESKTTKAGKPMWNINIDGVKYGVFDNPGDVTVGSVVTFEASQKGDYWNAKNFRLGGQLPNGAMTSASPSPFTPAAAPKAAREADPEREGRIVRQNATSSAAQIIAAVIESEPGKWDLDAAKKALFDLSKDIFEVNFKGYDAVVPF